MLFLFGVPPVFSIELFPPEGIFKPLIADPRWPHFSMAYQRYIDDDELADVASVSFGEIFNFIQSNAFYGKYDIGIQGAVFAVFNLDAPSKDLVNADYFVGIPISYAYDQMSMQVRVFHQSSHLGDEFLLRNRVERINLSYESIDLKTSYVIKNAFRIYAGSGYIFHKEPQDLKPWLLHYGIEYQCPCIYVNGKLRPVIGADFKQWQEVEWSTDSSLHFGFQFENPKLDERKIQLLIEYFTGHSPNGQFFDRKIEYIGTGVHFYF
ncbi:MAG: DUF1207 domain-containing protein [bacterium]